MKNYLTNGSGKLNLNECEQLFKILSLIEDKFFKKEIESRVADENFRKNNPVLFGKKQKPKILDAFRSIPTIGGENKNNKEKYKLKKNDRGNNDEIDLTDIIGNIITIEKDERLKQDFNLEELKRHGADKMKQIIKEEIYEENNKKVDEYVDEIKLGQKDWKDRYYRQKFHVSPSVNDKAFNDLKQ